MRVIAGSARRTNLETPAGEATRPTTDRIKETLFNIINYDLMDCRFLDVFAGSGAIGIEALSRGAECAVFVESASEPIRCIRANLEKTHLTERARVLAMDVFGAFKLLQTEEPFDFIFMDPPYSEGMEEKLFLALSNADFCTKDTQIIIEAAEKTEFGFLETMGFCVVREKKYKSNKHLFIQKME